MCSGARSSSCVSRTIAVGPNVLERWLANKTPAAVSGMDDRGSDSYCVSAVADESGEVCGFGMLDGGGEILLLYVSPEHVNAAASVETVCAALEERAREPGPR